MRGTRPGSLQDWRCAAIVRRGAAAAAIGQRARRWRFGRLAPTPAFDTRHPLLATKGGAPFVLVLVLALATAGPAKKRYEETAAACCPSCRCLNVSVWRKRQGNIARAGDVDDAL